MRAARSACVGLGCLLATLLTSASTRAQQAPSQAIDVRQLEAQPIEDTLHELGEPEQIGVFTLVVNEVPKGEITVVLHQGDVWLEPVELIRAGVTGFIGTRRQVEGRVHVSLLSLAPGIKHVLDEENIELRLSASPAYLAPTVIRFGKITPEGIEYRKDVTAFINYAFDVNEALELGLFADAGLSVGGHLLSSTMSVHSSGRAVRGMSSFTFNQPSQLRQIVLGDATNVSGDLGGSAIIGGFKLTRAFELDPYFVRTPVIGLKGAALVPSTLEVYVNGSRVRSERLDPGAFSIEQIPVSTGRGDAVYVLRDVFGNARVVSADYYLSPNLLAPGLSEYSYAVGLLREDIGTHSFRYASPAFMMRHRHGVGQGYTVGGRAEGTFGLANLGGNIAGATLGGQLDFAAAASFHSLTGQGGLAGLVAYTFASSAVTTSLVLRGQSPRYANLSLHPSKERSLLDLNANVAMPLPFGLSLSTRAGLRARRDAGASAEASVAFGAQLPGGWLLYSLVTQSVQREGPLTHAFVNLLYRFGEDNESAALGYSGYGDTQEATLDVQRPLPPGDGPGYRVSTGYGRNGARADVLGQYQNRYGRWGVDVRVREGQSSARLDAAGALVMLEDTGIFFTRPINRGFAVIKVPGVPGVRGYLENHEIGRTDDRGTLVLPNLLPYYANRVRIEPKDLPLDYQLDVTERLIAPSQRGGAVITFDARRTLFVRGTLTLREAGQRIIPAYGELRLRAEDSGEDLGDDGVATPIGADGAFEIESESGAMLRGMILFEGRSCAFDLQLPRTEEPVVDVGAVTCAP